MQKPQTGRERTAKSGAREEHENIRRKAVLNGRIKQSEDNKQGNKQILIVTYTVVIIFLGMIVYLVNFMVNDSEEIINNPYNKRRNILAEKVVRGNIYSADGKVLAKTITGNDGKDKRVYPYDNTFCHVIGRITNSMTGVEMEQCYPLLASHSNPFKKLANTFKGEKNQGDNVYTTLDANLQQIAYRALGNYKGAIVALEPSTGKILAMVSKPDYNPNTVEDDWDRLVEDEEDNSALLNRATQGLYPPGSTFKVMTAIEYVLENPSSYNSYSYKCNGHDSFEGNVINCYSKEKHGELNLSKSLAKSCNSSFADIGMKLNISSFKKLCEKFMFNKKLPVKFEYKKSSFELDKKSDTGELVQTVIGQGKTMITPLQNVMIAATIANNGEMMIPYVVDHTENYLGQQVKSYEPISNGRIIEEDVADVIEKFMKEVINDGTGASLSSLSYKVAGKTGSAEFDSEGTSHAWFIGYAPVKNPKIAVSIVVEGAGTGSQYAVPIAKEMFKEYLGS